MFFSSDNKDQIFRVIALPTAIKLIGGYGGLGDLGILFFFHQITSINQTQLSSAIKLHICFEKRQGLDFQRYCFTNGNKANWRMRIYAYANSQCLTSIIGDKKATLGSLHYNVIKHYVSLFNLTNKTLAIISLGFPEKNDDIDY